jgi:hypothetical protein
LASGAPVLKAKDDTTTSGIGACGSISMRFVDVVLCSYCRFGRSDQRGILVENEVDTVDLRVCRLSRPFARARGTNSAEA